MPRLFAIGVLLTILAAGAAYAQPAVEPLFVSLDRAASTAAAAAGPQTSRAALDRQTVGMRLDRLFASGAGRVLLNLGDRELVARFERLETNVLGHRSWVGVVEGVDHSHVSFTERAGVVAGVIGAGPDLYEIRTVTPGVYTLARLDESRIGAELEPLVDGTEPAAASLPSGDTAPDDGSVIDVLLLYTPSARTVAGGQAQMQAIAAQVVSDSNTAFGRSGVTARFRLAATSEIAISEAPSMATDLSTVTNSATARALRDQYRADLVQLLVNSPDGSVCGIAWLLSSLSSTNFNAYSVADVACVSQFTPTHEIGHSMGSHHAPEDGASGAIFPYSYGYKDPARGFRTLMAYACSGSSCPRVLNWSNPAVSHNGGVTGSNAQNNALSINNTAYVVSNFRQATAPPPPPPPPPPITPPGMPTGLTATVNGTAVTLSWTAVTADAGGSWMPSAATSYTVQVGNAPGNYGLFNGVVATTSVSGVAPPGTYFWRVIAANSAGAGPPSGPSQFTVGTPSCIPPGAPQNLNFTIAARTVTLTWSAPGTGTGPITYQLEAGSAPSLANLYNASVGTATTATATAPPATYYVRVRALNACGTSAPSNERTVVVQ